MTNREYFGEEGSQKLESRLQQFLDTESGFVIIYTGNTNKVTDVYRDICADCVLAVIEKTLTDAEIEGLLATLGNEHNHEPHP